MITKSTISRFRGIHGKLLALTLGVSMVSITFISLVLLRDFEASLVKNVEDEAIRSTQRMVNQIEAEFTPIEQTVSIISSMSPVMSMDRSEIISEIKRDEMNFFFAITEKLVILDSSGQEIATNKLDDNLKFRSDELKLDRYTDRMTSVYYAKNLNWIHDLPHTSILQHFRGFNTRGYVLADVSYRRLWKVADSQKIARSGFAYIMTQSGELVSYPDKRMIQTFRNDSLVRAQFHASPPVREIMKGKDAGYVRYTENDIEYFAAYRTMPRQNIGVIIQVPVDEITAEVDAVIDFLILIVAIIVFIAIIITLIVTKKLVTPIKQITLATKKIADGNLSERIQIKTGRDELGYLAQNVEFMRSKLKNYTDDLEFLVEEKIQQLKEIMDNIYQGLFTINLDGTVNPECSKKTTEILEIEKFENANLKELFRLRDHEYSDFKSWLELVKIKYKKMRWSKLQKLLSITQVEIHTNQDTIKYVDLNFQPLFDQKTGEINKIMVLAKDVTEDIIIENRIEIEREKNEREVKTIIALVKNSRTIITDFLADSHKRIRFILSEVEHFDNEYQSSVWMDELHTIKGNAGSLGFVDVCVTAHSAEDEIQAFKNNNLDKSEWAPGFRALLEELVESLDKLEELFKLLFKSEDEYIDVSKHKVAKIMQTIEILHNGYDEDYYQELVSLCERIQYKSAHFLTKKYHDLSEKFYNRTPVPAKLEVISSELELPPDTFSRFDDAIVQLLKNAFDHGCEGKANGAFVVKLIYNKLENEEQIIIKDNGVGIDPDVVAEKAIAQKLIEKEDLNGLSNKEKVNLIFLQSFSQKENVTIVSGRGVGMSVVQHNVEKFGGTIEVSSAKDEGSVFTIRVPT